MATYGTFTDGFTLSASELNTMYQRTTFTPQMFQPSSITLTTTSSGRYSMVNKSVHCSVTCIVQSVSGTANNRIEIALPVTASSGSFRVIGSGFALDSSVPDIFRVVCVKVSTTRVAFLTDVSTSLSTYLGQTGGPTFTLADNDSISVDFWYEAA